MTAVPAVAAPVHALLARAIDYAGLFPPAGLDPALALSNYVAYRKGEDAWALGRLVISAGVLEQLPIHQERPVELSVVTGPGISDDLRMIERFRGSGLVDGYSIAALEIKGTGDGPGTVAGSSPIRYFEIPLDDGLDQHLEAVRQAGGFAKVRTGGTTPGSFPDAPALTRFLMTAARLRLPFKATAGLHHPLRGSFPLTYQADAPSGIMYGYLNVAIAAMLAWGGGSKEEVQQGLLESDPGAIRFDRDAIQWRHERFPTELVARLRREFFHGFGSCSFREPLDELAPLVQAV